MSIRHARTTLMRLALCTLVAALWATTPMPAEQTRAPLSETLERGQVVNGTFSNRYFGIELPLPPGWIAATDEKMAAAPGPLGGIWKDIRSGTPLSTFKILPWVLLGKVNSPAAGAVGSSILLASMPFEPGSNPVPMLTFVEGLRKEFERAVPGQTVTVEQEQLGGRAVRYVDGTLGPKGPRQRQWAVQVRGQVVGIFGTYQTAAELAAIRDVLKKLVIEGPSEGPPVITPAGESPPPASGIPTVEPSPSGTDVVERGEVVKRIYRNWFFGFWLRVPEGWRVLTEEEMASGPPDISESIQQLKAGVPLPQTPTVPLILLENRVGRANIAAMAIRLNPAYPLTLAALENHARSRMGNQVPARRVTTGHDELSGQRIPYVDGPLPDGLHQREWIFLSRGYYVMFTGTYQGQTGLEQLRKAMHGLGWTVTVR